MENLTRAICHIYPLPEKELEALLKVSHEISLRKGEQLVCEGKTDNSIYFIKNGVLRGYHTDGEKEVTIWFSVAGEPAFSSWGYVENKPALITIEASCDSCILRFKKEDLEILFVTSVTLAAWGRKLFEQLLLAIEQSYIDFFRPLAIQRYTALIEKMPQIIREVPLKDIAGFLGMTPQSLSRIRAEYARKPEIKK